MENGFSFIILIILIPAFLSTIFIPYWTRKTESFGVTIPQDVYESPILKQIRKRYAVYTSSIAILIMTILLIVSIGVNETTASIYLTIAIFAYLIISFAIYLKFHINMKKLKEKSDWKKEKSQQLFISTTFYKEKLTYSNLWFLFSFVMAFILAFFTLQNYHLLPEQIPMQYNFSGEATSWAEKSYRSVLILPILMLYMTLLFSFINAIIARSKQQVDSENPKESIKQNAIFRKRWSLFIIITGNLISLLFAFIQVSFFYTFPSSIMMIVIFSFTMLVTVGAIYLAFTTGQGGSRIRQGSAKSQGNSINRDDDRYWKLGIFYVNREDPALFLEKRFGVGWTINIARPLAWITILVIIGGAILIPLLLS